MSPPGAKTTRLPPATWRQPDQRIPHHVTSALDQASLQMRGERARPGVEDQPRETPWAALPWSPGASHQLG